MRSLAFSLTLCLWQTGVFAQFNTPTIDGTIGAGEYGATTNGTNQLTSGAATWYLTWDDTYLYLAASGGWTPANDAINFFIDIDPTFPVNANLPANGSQTRGVFDDIIAQLPFNADYFLFAKDSYDAWATDDGAAGWNTATAFSITKANSGSTMECRIPWNTITSGAGRPASFNWCAYFSYDNGFDANGTFQPVPTANPSVASNSNFTTLWLHHYFTVTNTSNGTDRQPFEWESVTYRQDNSASGTGGYLLPAGRYWDITVNDNSPNNNDNTGLFYAYNNDEVCNRILLSNGSTFVQGDLYVGQGSGLFPADNTSGNVLAVLTIENEVRLFNFGRIDFVPEVSNPGDENNRRVNLVVTDTLTIMPTAGLEVGLFRLGNITVGTNGLLRASPTATGLTEFELTLSTVDNNGTIQFNGAAGAQVDLFTRGFMPGQNNVVFLTSSAGTGVFNLHKILIGKEVGYLRPVSTATPVELFLTGNLEIYSNLVARDGTGQLNFTFHGTGQQLITGALGETSEATVVATPTLPVTVRFNNLTIDNDNGLGNNNAGADVHFVSYDNTGFGNIDFEVEGILTLASGDLVTRDRVAPNGIYAVHNLTMVPGSTVSYSGAVSDVGGNPSTFVDGPLRWEIASAASTTLDFPVGKTGTLNGIAVGDYRRLRMQVDPVAATTQVYTAEMFIGDRSGAYAWPSPTPEIIANISNIRSWRVQESVPGFALDALAVTLDYGDSEYSDAVPAAGGLRILKDNGAGQWVNVQPLGAGGTASPEGEITSLNIAALAPTNVGDFVLANIDGFFNPLSAAELQLKGSLEAGGKTLRWQHELKEVAKLELQRSLGQGFEALADLPAGLPDGSYLDPEPGRAWYRLLATRMSGEVVLSNTVQLAPGSATLRVQEDRNAWLVERPAEGGIRWEVWSAEGRIVKGGEWSEAAALRIEKAGLSGGVYFLRLSDGRGSWSAGLRQD